jgi:protein-tyrosine phosphatase
MSLTFESPTHRGSQASDAYFTPLTMPNMLSLADSSSNNINSDSSGSSTPYYTAPINPGIHQEFLNAIQARQASQPTILNSPSSEQRPTLKMGPLANRRQMLQQQQQPQSHHKSAATAIHNEKGPLSFITPIDSSQLNELLNKYKQKSNSLLILDVRSFVQFSHSKIRNSINISIPNTILKRPTFTLDKVYEAIVLDGAREKLRTWQAADYIIFYDQQSQILQENNASAYLSAKLIKSGYKGKLHYLKGGFDSFSEQYKEQIESNSGSPTTTGSMNGSIPTGPPTTIGSTSDFTLNLSGNGSRRPTLRLNNLPIATPVIGPFTAPMPQFSNQAFNPFFSNIRQNIELSHGPIRERFPINLPPGCSIDPNNDDHIQISKTPRSIPGCEMDSVHQSCFKAPIWLRDTIKAEGPKLLAESYEKLERTEQRRLQNIMHFHSKHTSNPTEFPFSIVAGIEMGALNRYTNIWPYEYTRVKLQNTQSSDYINASYVQYIDSDEGISDARPETVDTNCIRLMKEDESKSLYRRYISTQGPLPATFNDFWQIVWEQNSRVIVMLTKEEEMNKIKCHRYWPHILNEPVEYGQTTVTLISECTHRVQGLENNMNEEDMIIIRTITISRQDDSRVITQLHYTGWMDFNVPDNPLGTLQIVQMADETQKRYTASNSIVGPMIVHCSAGCGRSGAFCAIDTTLYRLSHTDCGTKSDVLLETISRFREQRLSMVQTLRQFVFCYEAIWWWILGYGQGTHSKSLPSVNDMDTSL